MCAWRRRLREFLRPETVEAWKQTSHEGENTAASCVRFPLQACNTSKDNRGANSDSFAFENEVAKQVYQTSEASCRRQRTRRYPDGTLTSGLIVYSRLACTPQFLIEWTGAFEKTCDVLLGTGEDLRLQNAGPSTEKVQMDFSRAAALPVTAL